MLVIARPDRFRKPVRSELDYFHLTNEQTAFVILVKFGKVGAIGRITAGDTCSHLPVELTVIRFCQLTEVNFSN